MIIQCTLYALGDLGLIPDRVTPNFRMWESCRTMPLVGGFSRGSHVFPPFHSGTAPYSPQSPSSALKTSIEKSHTWMGKLPYDSMHLVSIVSAAKWRDGKKKHSLTRLYSLVLSCCRLGVTDSASAYHDRGSFFSFVGSYHTKICAVLSGHVGRYASASLTFHDATARRRRHLSILILQTDVATPECKGGGNGKSPRKPAKQRHRPALFPQAKFSWQPSQESNTVRIGFSNVKNGEGIDVALVWSDFEKPWKPYVRVTRTRTEQVSSRVQYKRRVQFPTPYHCSPDTNVCRWLYSSPFMNKYGLHLSQPSNPALPPRIAGVTQFAYKEHSTSSLPREITAFAAKGGALAQRYQTGRRTRSQLSI
ncbi:hypothetical protein PR048_029807 [Dryococelus australis]|uniref:Uncharacterized protein n=1 Tax=Dryococelus australis TaxID=614101 RepID=A0ABQ9GB53_9NEOP|nr:hypothetical protein PR048_029807 [Dryococelus australis]